MVTVAGTGVLSFALGLLVPAQPLFGRPLHFVLDILTGQGMWASSLALAIAFVQTGSRRFLMATLGTVLAAGLLTYHTAHVYRQGALAGWPGPPAGMGTWYLAAVVVAVFLLLPAAGDGWSDSRPSGWYALVWLAAGTVGVGLGWFVETVLPVPPVPSTRAFVVSQPLAGIPLALLLLARRHVARYGSDQEQGVGTMLTAVAAAQAAMLFSQRDGDFPFAVAHVLYTLAPLLYLVVTIWALREAVEQQRKLAHVDPVSGLGNSLRWAGLAARAGRLPQPVAVVTLCAEDLPVVNKGLGHGAGDDLLRHIAALVRERLPARGQAFRLAGSLFAMVLPGTSVETAMTVARALEASAARSRCFLHGPSGPVLFYPRVTCGAAAGQVAAGPTTGGLKGLLSAAENQRLHPEPHSPGPEAAAAVPD